MSWKDVALAFASAAVTLVIIDLFLEVLPVSTDMGKMPVDSAHPTLHFRPNRDYVHSTGALLTHPNGGHINNYGYVNDQDYLPRDSRPLLSVIGDSYIEAVMVPYGQTLQGRLAHDTGDAKRVYSFGISGASLLDYANFADFARREFSPGWMVVNVVGNDFDEMLARYRQYPGLACYREDASGALIPQVVDYRPWWLKPLVSHTALGRYLVLNIGQTPIRYRVQGWINSLSATTTPKPSPSDTPPSGADAQRRALSKRAVDQVLGDFAQRAGLPPSHILFLIDSLRVFDQPSLEAAQASYFGEMRTYFMGRARQNGFEVADMQDWFQRRHDRDGAVFQFEDDGHWNAIGHEEAYHAVLASKVFAGFSGAANP